MFLLSVPPPVAPISAGAAGTVSPQQTQEVHQEEEPLQRQSLFKRQKQLQVDMLLSITQSCNLDVAPISMALFRAKVSWIARLKTAVYLVASPVNASPIGN